MHAGAGRSMLSLSFLSGLALLFWKAVGFSMTLIDDVFASPSTHVRRLGPTTGALATATALITATSKPSSATTDADAEPLLSELDSNSGVLYAFSMKPRSKSAGRRFWLITAYGGATIRMVQRNRISIAMRRRCLEQLTGTHVDFQVGAALAKLECYKFGRKSRRAVSDCRATTWN